MAAGDGVTSARVTSAMRRINALENIWNLGWSTREISGTTTSTSTNKLVDSSASFDGNIIFPEDDVRNDTDATTANVDGVDSSTQIDLDSDIFTSGEDYTITTKKSHHAGYLAHTGVSAGGSYIYTIANGSNPDYNINDIIRLDTELETTTRVRSSESDLQSLSYNATAGKLFIKDSLSIAAFIESSATSTSTGKLVDSGQAFTSAIRVGHTVVNTGTLASANVASVDSDTQLTLDADIIASGEGYSISGERDRVRRFQEDGTLDYEVLVDVQHQSATITPLGFASTTAKEAVYTFEVDGKYYTRAFTGDDGTENEVLTIDPTGATSGDDVGIRGTVAWSDGNVALTIYIDSDYGECRIYDTSGTLQSTIPRPTTHTSISADSFNNPLMLIDNNYVVCTRIVTSSDTPGGPATSCAAAFHASGKYKEYFNIANFGDPSSPFIDGGTLYGLLSVLGYIDGGFYGMPGPTVSGDIARVELTAPQTEWYRYPTPGSGVGNVSLGSSNYGVSVPATNALQGYVPHYFELRDVRDAIESICTDYLNPDTGVAYTTTAGSNNIFRVAIDSGQDDWTTPTVTHGDAITDEHWNDIELVLTQLEASELA